MTSARWSSVIFSQRPISRVVLPQPWQYLRSRSMRQMLMHGFEMETGGIMISFVWMSPIVAEVSAIGPARLPGLGSNQARGAAEQKPFSGQVRVLRQADLRH